MTGDTACLSARRPTKKCLPHSLIYFTSIHASAYMKLIRYQALHPKVRKFATKSIHCWGDPGLQREILGQEDGKCVTLRVSFSVEQTHSGSLLSWHQRLENSNQSPKKCLGESFCLNFSHLDKLGHGVLSSNSRHLAATSPDPQCNNTFCALLDSLIAMQKAMRLIAAAYPAKTLQKRFQRCKELIWVWTTEGVFIIDHCAQHWDRQ